MWQDEFDDNNPYGSSLDGNEDPSSPIVATTHVHDDHKPPSPSSHQRPAPLDETDDEDYGQIPRRTKPGGYDSRVEQILYENPGLDVLITDAGKSPEGGGRYIVYTIRTGDLEVRRRYSEFATLREALVRLHPTLVVPPIPEKHTMADYAANPTNAKQDHQIIEYRKRMLAVFLNRCRKMGPILADGVWWRFLDPNASWNEVLNSAPVSNIPKSIVKAPPLDTANPTPAHSFLPVPSSSAKLRGVNGAAPPNAFEGSPGAQVFRRFPPDSANLSEQELDPYFVSFEQSIKELEQLLTGPMEKVNRRTVSHLAQLSSDLSELGAKFNAFALNEHTPSLGAAIERVGQAADTSYLVTEELSTMLGANFAEPMRENAQFAGVVRSVLRYRVLKRVQQEMTNDELYKKKELLSQLENSEAEAQRIEQYLSNSQQIQPPRRSASMNDGQTHHRRSNSQEDTASIDSDFPPTHSEFPSASTGHIPSSPQGHKKTPSGGGGSITSKIFGPLRHAMQGVVDVDPERTRRDTIGKTRESITHLEDAQVAAAKDVKDASADILQDLKRFQADKEEDLRRYMLAYAKAQIAWARKSKETWEEAKTEIEKVEEL